MELFVIVALIRDVPSNYLFARVLPYCIGIETARPESAAPELFFNLFV